MVTSSEEFWLKLSLLGPTCGRCDGYSDDAASGPLEGKLSTRSVAGLWVIGGSLESLGLPVGPSVGPLDGCNVGFGVGTDVVRVVGDAVCNGFSISFIEGRNDG